MRPQRGISIISMMVGLTISMIIVLAMMSLYKTTLKTTVTGKIGAAQDGNRTTGFLSAQSSLQGAGYGIDPVDLSKDLLLYDSVADSTSTPPTAKTLSTTASTGNALFWRMNDGAMSCALLYAPSGGGLKYFTASGANCNSASTAWSTFTLNSGDAWLIPPNLPSGATAPDGVLANVVSISVSKTGAAGCTPFGIQAPTPTPATVDPNPVRLIVQLSMQSSNATTAGTDFKMNSTTCLANIHLAS
ncbi:PilW family protein [Jeongeupia naejangsanensis]